jgi:hypothetical protein
MRILARSVIDHDIGCPSNGSTGIGVITDGEINNGFIVYLYQDGLAWKSSIAMALY